MDWVIKNIWQNEQLVNWLSAIGTIGAVWVSLWLAVRDERRKGKLEVNGIKRQVSVMHPTRNFIDPISVISCEIFNYSKFPITISTIKVNVYKRRWIKKKFISGGILLTDEDLGRFSKLPMIISPFEADTWMYSKYLFDNYTKTQIMPKIDKDKEKQILIEFRAVDSFGKFYKKKIKIRKNEIEKYLAD
ncbi:hypothetical protein [Enterococcus xiangfangensis]|uniref:hypothetical protein n=1 Tax=Enterococcus xiangfangensis TaxID=1296537 RepID=UPI0010F7CB81|nr:hypothetical protein [Enterococcus xiangfangensis]MBM7710623.1 hypothetical protein [Enterococcus xiangfangensis]